MKLRKFSLTIFSRIVLAISALALGACGMGPDEAKTITISGQLTYTGDTPMPARSSARVSMIERSDQGEDTRIVAERSLHDIGRKRPIRFDIAVDRSLVNPDEQYGLRAQITSPDGTVLWTTLQPAKIAPFQHRKSIQLALDEPPQADKQPTFIHYVCGDGFLVSTAKVDNQALVRLGNRRLTLTKRIAENTQIFSNRHNNTLRYTDNNTFDLKVDGTNHAACHPEKNGSERDIDTAG